MMKRLLAVVLLFLLAASPVAAATVPAPVTHGSYNPIAAPSVHTLDAVYAYRNALELNDWLLIGVYTTTFAATPSEGGIDITFVARLMAGATEYANDTAYPYKDDGYNEGIFSIYLSAAEVSSLGLTWGGAYEMIWQGNPSFTWTGGIPTVFNNTFTWYDGGTVAATSTAIGVRIRLLAAQLETTWADATIDLRTTMSGTAVLSSQGSDYFTQSIANLITIQPNLFGDSTSGATYIDQPSTTSYLNTLRTRLVGTPFDMTSAADDWGLSTIWFSSIMWLIASLIAAVIVIGASYQTGAGNRSYEFAWPIFLLMLLAGAYAGFLEPLVAVFALAIMVLLFIFRFVYEQAG